MSLFPQIDPTYYTDHDRAIHQIMENTYADAIQLNQTYWSEADIDMRFYTGDQTLYNDLYGNLPATRPRNFNFNLIRPIVNMVSGYQRQHRLSMVASPREYSDQKTADQFTKVMMWATDQNNILNTVSDAFESSLVTGMALLQVYMDYRRDPINGDIKVEACPYNEFLIDPFFSSADLSDCRYLWTRKYLSKRQILSLLPQHTEEIETMQARGWRDGKFQFQAQSYNYAMNDLYTYDEYWYQDFRSRKMLLDPETQETLEWRGDEDRLKKFLSVYPHVQVIDQIVPSCKLAISVQGKVLFHDWNPMGIDRMPFVPVFCYYHPEMPYFSYRVQGMVRGLRDAQYLFNRRKIIELSILESQINSGWKAMEGAAVDPHQLLKSGQGQVVFVKKGNTLADIEQIMPPQIPPSMIQLSEILSGLIRQISGVNEELLGSAVDDKSGILSMLRQGAGLTTLQKMFDQLNMSQKLLGTIMIELIQANFTPAKIERIIEEEPSEQFYNQMFGKYDVVVEEGLNTSTQRQMQFAQLLQLREMNIPVPTELLIKTSTLQNKQELIEGIQQQEQMQQQMQQTQAQSQMEVQNATIQSLQARAMYEQGRGIEAMTRSQENQAGVAAKLADAERSSANAALDEIKAVKELQNIDLHQLERLIQLVQNIKLMNAPDLPEASETPEPARPMQSFQPENTALE